MAYDKIIPLRARLDHCLDYVLNEEKSSLSYALTYAENPEKSRQLVTGVNCQARTAFQEMQATKRRWDKKGGILGYHIIHSYAPGEVTPEQAHVAGVEFARRLLAGEDWRELWEPAQELALYPSKEAAARAVELVPLSELLPKDWKGAEER